LISYDIKWPQPLSLAKSGFHGDFVVINNYNKGIRGITISKRQILVFSVFKVHILPRLLDE
jgi:hypothetical protein